jgi:tRNA G10  N-methylase Trm11
MKQVFILGRNSELSRAEILAYANTRRLDPKEILFEENYLIIDIEKEINIQNLGGTILSGNILSEGCEDDVHKYITDNDLYDSDKFKYGVFGNVDSDMLKEKFKSEKRKAVLKHGRRGMKSQEGERLEIPNADIHFFLTEHENIIYFGTLDKEYDYAGVKKRDMEKPVRREELAISPRLSKILINLSGAGGNRLMLDPFCGIGGILIEALVQDIRVYGIDKDANAVKGALENMKWLKQNFPIMKPYIIERWDAKKVPNKQYDAIATETPLGKVVKHKPNQKEAEGIIRNFENIIIPILAHLKNVKKPKARIAITFPKIREAGVDYLYVEGETGLKKVVGPILESREKQFIGRDIVVFE